MQTPSKNGNYMYFKENENEEVRYITPHIIIITYIEST